MLSVLIKAVSIDHALLNSDKSSFRHDWVFWLNLAVFRLSWQLFAEADKHFSSVL